GVGNSGTAPRSTQRRRHPRQRDRDGRAVRRGPPGGVTPCGAANATRSDRSHDRRTFSAARGHLYGSERRSEWVPIDVGGWAGWALWRPDRARRWDERDWARP